jgi:hypothetical protein
LASHQQFARDELAEPIFYCKTISYGARRSFDPLSSVLRLRSSFYFLLSSTPSALYPEQHRVNKALESDRDRKI